jgi:hypothetical protein
VQLCLIINEKLSSIYTIYIYKYYGLNYKELIKSTLQITNICWGVTWIFEFCCNTPFKTKKEEKKERKKKLI